MAQNPIPDPGEDLPLWNVNLPKGPGDTPLPQENWWVQQRLGGPETRPYNPFPFLGGDWKGALPYGQGEWNVGDLIPPGTKLPPPQSMNFFALTGKDGLKVGDEVGAFHPRMMGRVMDGKIVSIGPKGARIDFGVFGEYNVPVDDITRGPRKDPLAEKYPNNSARNRDVNEAISFLTDRSAGSPLSFLTGGPAAQIDRGKAIYTGTQVKPGGTPGFTGGGPISFLKNSMFGRNPLFAGLGR